jgi:hypothetical protein
MVYFVRLDKVVEEYNEVYFKPVKKMLDDLYAKIVQILFIDTNAKNSAAHAVRRVFLF